MIDFKNCRVLRRGFRAQALEGSEGPSIRFAMRKPKYVALGFPPEVYTELQSFPPSFSPGVALRLGSGRRRREARKG